MNDRLRVHEGLGAVPREAWNALVGDGSPFLRWELLRAFEETVDEEESARWVPQHVTLWSGGEVERLVAAVPLYRRARSSGEFVPDGPWIDAARRLGRPYYPKLVAAVPYSPVAGGRLLVARGEDRPARMRQLLTGIAALAGPSGASSLQVLYPDLGEAAELERLGLALRPGIRHRFRNEGYRTFDDFLARFPAKRRAQIRRERAAVAAAGVVLETLVGAEVRADLADEMALCYRGNVARHPGNRAVLTNAFFERLVSDFAEHLHVVVARLGGRIVGMSINVLGGDGLYGRIWGSWQQVPLLHFAACYYEPIAWCIAHGVGMFDPGAGGEHKPARGFLVESQPSAFRIYDPVLGPLLERSMAGERAYLSARLDELRRLHCPFKGAW